MEKLAITNNNHPKYKKALRNISITAYAAGFETVSTMLVNAGDNAQEGDGQTVATIEIFIIAMLLYPQIQSRAQSELDRIVGQRRLPEITDRPDLPYIYALCQEVLRWQPVAPLGAPHRVIKEDIYHGMLIPKGTVLMYNSW